MRCSADEGGAPRRSESPAAKFGLARSISCSVSAAAAREKKGERKAVRKRAHDAPLDNVETGNVDDGGIALDDIGVDHHGKTPGEMFNRRPSYSSMPLTMTRAGKSSGMRR